MIQSMIAVGTGGITGRGLMDGLQKLFYLPEPHNDFIFSVIGEELGLIGATVVVACFCVITWRGLRTAMRAPGSVRRVRRDRPDHDDRLPGVLQHQRGTGAAADQGHPAAVRQRRRLVAADQHDRDGGAAQRVAARVADRRW